MGCILKIEDPSETQDDLATGDIHLGDLMAGVALVDITQASQGLPDRQRCTMQLKWLSCCVLPHVNFACGQPVKAAHRSVQKSMVIANKTCCSHTSL